MEQIQILENIESMDQLTLSKHILIQLLKISEQQATHLKISEIISEEVSLIKQALLEEIGDGGSQLATQELLEEVKVISDEILINTFQTNQVLDPITKKLEKHKIQNTMNS